MRSAPCTGPVRAGRLAKAEQFLAAAEVVRALSDEHAEVSDAFVTLCVHGGIAACDVICCVRPVATPRARTTTTPSRWSRPPDPQAAKHLAALLGLKTKSGYSHTPVTTTEFTRAERAAEALLEAAHRVHASSKT